MIEVIDIKKKIIELFNLEDVTPDEIDENEPLFDEGIGLDSVDAIELIIYLDNEFGIKFSDMSESKEAFASTKALCEYINSHKKS